MITLIKIGVILSGICLVIALGTVYNLLRD